MADEADAALATVASVVEDIQIAKINIIDEAALGDFWPGLILGINACFGTLWWILSWLIYIKNSPNDSKLKTKASTEVLPIGFFWERIDERGGSYTYLALSMLFNFIAFLFVSVLEMITWILYMVGEPAYFGWYVNIIGYYGSLNLYVIPPLFSILHIAITLEGKINQTPGSYCLFLTLIGVTMWLLNSFLHIFFAERLAAHIAKTLPYEQPNYTVQVEEKKTDSCKIPRGSMTEAQHEVACEALAKANEDQAGEERGFDAAEEEEEDNDSVNEDEDADVEEGEEAF